MSWDFDNTYTVGFTLDIQVPSFRSEDKAIVIFSLYVDFKSAFQFSYDFWCGMG